MAAPSEAAAPFEPAYSAPRPSRWQRTRRISLIALALIVLLPGVYLYFQKAAHDDLQAAIAEVNQLDPGWRLDELLARRRDVPPGKNSATVVIAARKLFGSSNFKVQDKLDDVPPPLRLQDDVAELLRGELKPLAAAIAEAGKLAKLPSGRFTTAYTPDFISTVLPDVQSIRPVAALLHLDIWLKAHEGDFQGAWVSAQAMLNAGRAVGDEPLFLTLLIRTAVQSMTVANLERILGQGEVPASALAEMAKALEEESAEPLLRIGARGERAGMHQLFEKVESGEVQWKNVMTVIGGKGSAWDERLDDLVPKGMIIRSHAWYLRAMSRVVEASQFSAMEQERVLKEVEKSVANAPRIANLLFPAVTRLAEAERREDTRMACAVAALAAEQFRLAQQRWPGSLEDLVKAGFLKNAPMDLYDGKPLRLRQAADGLVLYSIGADGTYRGEALDNLTAVDQRIMGQRIEFRLWALAARRRPPQGAR